MAERIFKRGQGRVFLQAAGAGPGNAVAYLGTARLGGFAESLGDITPIRSPSRQRYGEYEVVDETRGEAGLPTSSLVMRLGLVNPILTLTCPGHLQVHYGKCKDPQNFNGGWEKLLAFERFYFTNRSSDDLGALDQGDDGEIVLTGDLTARMLWQGDLITLAAKGGTEIQRIVADVHVGDYISCGECGYESNGAQRFFVLVQSSAGSPGLPAEVLVTEDQGATFSQYDITTLTDTDQPNRLALAGAWLVVISHDTGSLHVAALADPSTWTEVTTGFVAGGEPMGIFTLSSTQTWICGDGGTIYFTDDPAGGVTVQADGTLSAADLAAIHGCDAMNLIAVGAAGAVLVTANGGATWALADTSPTVDNLTCCWMRSAHCWIVGDDAGHLWYTKNGGASWAELRFASVAGTGAIGGIAFADHPDSPFGYLVHNTGAKGFIYRTLDGGNSWYQLPDGPGATPDNDSLNAVACAMGPTSANFVVAGGDLDGTNGVVIVGVG
jgi:photosystem II stability/assembly factor-like uncharacterized protein